MLVCRSSLVIVCVLVGCGRSRPPPPAAHAQQALVATLGTCTAGCRRTWPLRGDRTDEQPTLQAGLDWLAERGGGVLAVPRGRYALGSGLAIAASGISIIGAGKGDTVLEQLGPMREGLIVVGGDRPISRVTVRSLGLEGTGTVLGTYEELTINNIGIRLAGDASDVLVEDVVVTGFGVGVAPLYRAPGETTLHRSTIRDSRFEGLAPAQLKAHFGIWLNADTTRITDNVVAGFSYAINPSYASHDNRIQGNRVQLPLGGGVGIYMSSATRTLCDGNEVRIELPANLTGYRGDGCIKVGAALHPTRSSHFVVSNNVCVNGSIKLAHATDGVVSGNAIRGAPTSGIYLDPYVDATRPQPTGTRIKVEGNTIIEPRGNGIFFPVADGVTIANNTISGAASAGIRVERAVQVVITGNRVRNSGDRDEVVTAEGASPCERCSTDHTPARERPAPR